MNIPILRRTGYDPRANLAFEEELFTSLRSDPTPACLFYSCDPCIILGRSNVPAEWVFEQEARADGVPLIRRFSGGGAVYLDRGVLNYSFLVPKKALDGYIAGANGKAGPSRYIDFFRSFILRALSRGGSGLQATGISDISLNGRKISGNAQRVGSTVVLHHGTIMLACPLWQIERYLRIPANRPGVPHRGFVTGLREEGWLHSDEKLREWLVDEFTSTWQGLGNPSGNQLNQAACTESVS